MNYYEVLDVSKDATPEQLKVAKRRAAQKHHPDKGGDPRAMVRINRAYDTLSDPQKREYYDLHGEDEPKRQTIETQALQVLYNIILRLSDEVADDFDFVDALLVNMRTNRDTIRNNEPKLRQLLRKTQRQREMIRHKTKDADNLLARVFDQKIAAVQEKIASIPGSVAVADKALEILRDYEYAGPKTTARPDPLSGAPDLNVLLEQLMRGARY